MNITNEESEWIETVARMACEITMADHRLIWLHDRHQEVADARSIAMHFLTECGLPYSKVMLVFNRDKSTITYAKHRCRNVPQLQVAYAELVARCPAQRQTSLFDLYGAGIAEPPYHATLHVKRA